MFNRPRQAIAVPISHSPFGVTRSEWQRNPDMFCPSCGRRECWTMLSPLAIDWQITARKYYFCRACTKSWSFGLSPDLSKTAGEEAVKRDLILAIQPLSDSREIKFTPEMLYALRAQRAAGHSWEAIASHLRISSHTVRKKARELGIEIGRMKARGDAPKPD